MCGGYLVKGDYLPPPVGREEIVVDEPDPEPEGALPVDDGSADDLAVDEGLPGDSGPGRP